MTLKLHRTLFGVLFVIIGIVSIYRVYIYRDFSGRGRVVTLFYGLISFASIFRSIWFFTFSLSDVYFLPVKPIRIGDPYWQLCFLSELLTSFGSLFLYLIFILIACYWNQLLQETSSSMVIPINTDHSDALSQLVLNSNIGMIELFFTCSGVLLFFTLINVVLFASRFFNSEDMVLYDSVFLTSISLITLIVLTALSKRIQDLLVAIGTRNNHSTQAQIRRIIAITYAANFFFICRVAIESAFLIAVLILSIKQRSLSAIVADIYWDSYLVLKYSSEVIILVLELFISTAIKSYGSANTQSSGQSTTSAGALATRTPRKGGMKRHQDHGSSVSEATPLMSQGAKHVTIQSNHHTINI